MSQDFIKKVFTFSLGVPLLWILLSAMKFIPESTILFAAGIGCGGFLLLILDVGIKYSNKIRQAMLETGKGILVLIGIGLLQLVFGVLMIAFAIFFSTKNGFVGLIGMLVFGTLIYKFLKWFGD